MAVTESLGYNLLTAANGLSPADFTGLATTAGFQLAIVGQTEDGWKTMFDVIEAVKGGQEISVGVMSPRIDDLAYLLQRALGDAIESIVTGGDPFFLFSSPTAAAMTATL
ncbi:hypothetical protein AIOL_003688 [Candidatus Rhodobacter oscarellae]|uniref:Uncharacterized protein n=1 Tax=Candidatus Rhodobacter oscarellae TaxID=1675527 RepID=A0A0J9EAM1_9RHOB|nr:hypothetical protein [Candidatus Rhodobacter lobularis]KMW58709.1 hypothetical protein AIOL_003688 [Candidatus Rhodobacter lobularis]